MRKDKTKKNCDTSRHMRSNKGMTQKATVNARHSLPTLKTGTHDLIHAIEHQHTGVMKPAVNDC